MASSSEKSGCLPEFLQSFVGRDTRNLERGLVQRRDEKISENNADFYDDTEYLKPGIAPYRLRDDFLSNAELSLFYVLKQLIGEQAVLMTKVRLADVFFVARPHENAGAFSQISQKHIDFLVCHPQTLKPLFGIELDDSSHKREKRQIRDEFVNEVFSEAQLPLVRITVQRSYDRAQLAALMMPYLNTSISAVAAVQQVPDLPLQSAVPLCPKCGVDMVLRTAKQGKHIGQQFYACPNYPRCRETARA